jgi:hypothetical protein
MPFKGPICWGANWGCLDGRTDGGGKFDYPTQKAISVACAKPFDGRGKTNLPPIVFSYWFPSASAAEQVLMDANGKSSRLALALTLAAAENSDFSRRQPMRE